MAVDRPVAPVPTLNIANIITFIRILLVPVFVWFFLMGGTGWRLAAAGVFLLAALTDRLDGYLARSRGLITDLGKLMDPIADKALVISALALLTWDGLVPWWVTALILIREFGITFMRMGMRRRAVMAASQGGKLKTVLQMMFLTGMLVPWHGFLPAGAADVLLVICQVLMYLALAVTLVTGLMYVRDAVVLSRTPPPEPGP
ncbi:MAG: CDP-diacylglycerol--glycerol-3-phosphate 3-phosphatidyltransferase [bacterium]|nr:CDP-diacylglycerol--glycerol-3-phosphate 3-phosphatidyltransferase [bacterium]